MDFNAFTKKAKEMALGAGEKIKKATDDALEKTAQSFAKSKVFIKGDEQETKKEKLEKLIKENKKVIIIFGKQGSSFFKKSLLMFPVLFTKGWAQNFILKLYALDEDEAPESYYDLKKLPSLIIFKEKKVAEIVEGEEAVMNIVKTLSLEVEKVKK